MPTENRDVGNTGNISGHFGTIIAIGVGKAAPSVGSLIRALCIPAGGNLVAVRGEGIVQTVTNSSPESARFEVILQALDPLPEGVLSWSVQQWHYPRSSGTHS
jgi:hypothetical protein